MSPISSRPPKGLALTRAFTRITDAKLRRSIVDLVEQIAAREGARQALSADRHSGLSGVANLAICRHSRTRDPSRAAHPEMTIHEATTC